MLTRDELHRHWGVTTPPPTLGAFALLERIGHGGMAEVWRGQHPATGTPVAVKLVTGVGSNTRVLREALANEVRAMARLDHPGIVAVLDYGELGSAASRVAPGLPPSTPYLVMEWADAGTLRPDPAAGWPTLRDKLHQLLDALAHAHARGVIHRDLKPSNVLVTTEGRLWLADFGIAQALSPHRDGVPAEPVSAGTATYMAPEQILGLSADEGPWTDLYALGCLAFTLATGYPPFVEPSREDVLRAHCLRAPPPLPMPGAPEGFEAWVHRLLAKVPRDRFTLAADALRALEALDPAAERSAPADGGPPSPPRLLDAGLGVHGLRTIPLSGREPERRLLGEALVEADEQGATRVVELRGPGGCGKTRLAEWLVERAAEQGTARCIWATFGPAPGGDRGLASAIRRFLGVVGSQRAEALHRLRAHPAEPDLDRLTADERARLADMLATDVVAEASPAERHAAVLALVAALTQTRPVILVLDDAHFSAEALAFVEHALRSRTRSPRLLVVLTVREEALEDRPRAVEALDRLLTYEGVRRLELGPLAPADHADLIGSILGLEHRLAGRLAERTAGNPLFAIQLVGDWVQRGQLVVTKRGFELAEGIRARVPEGIHELWMGRIRRLLEARPEEERDRARLALGLAARLGPEVALEELRDACDEAGVEVPDGLLDALASRRLARVDATLLVFEHGLLAESLRQEDREDAADLERACARALMRAAPTHQRRERIGRHLHAAGEGVEAAPYLLAAAKLRVRTCDYGAATELATMAEAGLGADRSRAERARLTIVRAEAALMQARLDEAEECLTDASRLSERDAEVTANVCQLRARICLRRAQNEEAVVLFREAYDLTRALGDTREAGRSRHGLAEACKLLGRFDDAISAYAESHRLLERAGDHATAASVNIGLADAYRRVGRAEEAVPLLERGVIEMREAGDAYSVAVAVNVLGDIARGRGDLALAERHYDESCEGFGALASEEATIVRMNMGLVQLARRRHAAARATFERGARDLAAEGRAGYLVFCHAGLWACDVAEGRWADAESHGRLVAAAVSGLGVLDIDLAGTLEAVARLADEAGESARGAEARRLAELQWEGLGLVERARNG